ncbi:MAG: hypothetical protein LBT98_01000, partial [Puniceicoccales bacterium]|nr:hypothetical protein [Puniceicoccales bacterium]
AVYGIFRPQQGRSVYGALERLFFPHNFYPAACFLSTRYRCRTIDEYFAPAKPRDQDKLEKSFKGIIGTARNSNL